MITIDLLNNHLHVIPQIATIWHETIGKKWSPEVQIVTVEKWYRELLTTTPAVYVAFYDNIPVGSCSLQMNDGVRPDLAPWLSTLIVDPQYQKRGIGKMLIEATKQKAYKLGFKALYLFTYDPTVVSYYIHLGWSVIDKDTYKQKPVTIMNIYL